MPCSRATVKAFKLWTGTIKNNLQNIFFICNYESIFKKHSCCNGMAIDTDEWQTNVGVTTATGNCTNTLSSGTMCNNPAKEWHKWVQRYPGLIIHLVIFDLRKHVLKLQRKNVSADELSVSFSASFHISWTHLFHHLVFNALVCSCEVCIAYRPLTSTL